MKRLFSILTWGLVGINAMANDSTAVVGLDSMSYAIGYHTTSMAMTNDNEVMRNEDDYKEFIRGLEEHILKTSLAGDSSYVMSYAVGGMEGVFMTDAYHGEKDKSFFPYIIEGLRKVIDDKVVLPKDTIEAMAVLDRYTKQDGNLTDMDADAQREFFNAYGTLKPYQRGLQEYINSLKPGMNVLADRKAFAKGMADLLEVCLFDKPKTAYDFGKYASVSVNMILMDKRNYNVSSYIAGAKAALNLGEQLIDKELVDSIFNKYDKVMADSVAIDETGKEERYGKLMNYVMQLDMGLNNISSKFVVDWVVTGRRVVPDTEIIKDMKVPHVADIFGDLLMNFDMECNKCDGFLLAEVSVDDGDLYKSISSRIKEIPLSKGYEWFCGRYYKGRMVVGIMESKTVLKAKAIEASVEFVLDIGSIDMPWKFDDKGAKAWIKFTEENISRPVVIEINGIFVCAPKILSQIKVGRCSVSNPMPETVNRLFKGAKEKESDDKVDNAADEIEVIEVE